MQCLKMLTIQYYTDIGHCPASLFLPIDESHLYSFASGFLLLKTHATFYSVFSQCVTVHCKGERMIGNLIENPYGLRNAYRNSQDYAQKPQRNCTFMNTASVLASVIHCHSGTHPRNVQLLNFQLQDVQFIKRPVYKTFSFYNIHLQKVQVTKSPDYKTSNYITSNL